MHVVVFFVIFEVLVLMLSSSKSDTKMSSLKIYSNRRLERLYACMSQYKENSILSIVVGVLGLDISEMQLQSTVANIAKTQTSVVAQLCFMGKHSTQTRRGYAGRYPSWQNTSLEHAALTAP